MRALRLRPSCCQLGLVTRLQHVHDDEHANCEVEGGLRHRFERESGDREMGFVPPLSEQYDTNDQQDEKPQDLVFSVALNKRGDRVG